MVFLGLVPDTVSVNVKSVEKLVTNILYLFIPETASYSIFLIFKIFSHTHTYIYGKMMTLVEKNEGMGVISYTESERAVFILFPIT